ncbi:MAG: FAD-dependent oxidoreductase, partial [Bacteroidales bacterium]|nr:FAD-dependent oxidoreductase [Bacteroidales bacterium]
TIAMDTANSTMWIFEPHIAEQVFEDFVKEFTIRVYRNERLDRSKGVKLKNGKIQSIKALSGQVYQGSIFIDGTYEGDLMAAAGVHYTVGRESNSVYLEKWNGVQPNVFHHGHNFGKLNISPYVIPGDPASGILRGISGEKPGDRGDGDKKVQAYCYRMCLTTNDKNRVPFEKPEDYDPAQYELLLRVFNSGWRETFEKFDPIPNLKTDVNNHGPISFDYIGMNYDYPEASYERRKEIIDAHQKYQQGWLYFIANDPRVPKDVQSKMKTWGLAKDEFADNGNWPYQIYVREARRMIGQTVMTENEIQGVNPVADPIGMGSYTMDSHNIQRYITTEGYVQNEGDIGIHPKTPYKISLGAILPKKEECSNLLVTLAVSSSHIAFGSIRMEPVFMILGQSAGIVAGMALNKKVGIHDLTYTEIKARLLESGQVLEKQN